MLILIKVKQYLKDYIRKGIVKAQLHGLENADLILPCRGKKD